MTDDDRPVGDYEPERPSGLRLAVRGVLLVGCLLGLLGSLAVIGAAGWAWLDAERNPPAGVGGIVGILGAIGVFGGAGGVLLSGLGLAALWVTRLPAE